MSKYLDDWHIGETYVTDVRTITDSSEKGLPTACLALHIPTVCYFV